MADTPPAQPAQAGYQVLARKYRPRIFEDLIGQEAMVQTLRNAFQTNRIAHAFILTGVRGVGKTTTARVLARALNYADTEAGIDAPTLSMEKEGTHCADIMAGNHVDVLEMDAASNTGIDNIREIIENVRYAPVSARYKVYIIDEVHMLSRSAFNGLLKTLEEPPPYAKFIFATTEIRTVPITVLSRCQRFDLRRLTLDEIALLLRRVCDKESVALADETLAVIARAADGSARDALSLLDRAFAYSGDEAGAGVQALDATNMRVILGMANRERLFDLFDLLLRGDLSAALAEFEEHYNMGTEPATIIADLAELTYWLTRIKFVAAASDDVTYSEAMRLRGAEAAKTLSTRILTRVWQILSQGYEEVRFAAQARAAAEMVLIRLAHLADAPTPEDLIKQYEATNSTQPQSQAQPQSQSQSQSQSQPQPPQAQAVGGNAAAAPQQQQQPQPETPPKAQLKTQLKAQLKAVPNSAELSASQGDASIKNDPKIIAAESDPQVKAALAVFAGAEIRSVIPSLESETESDPTSDPISDPDTDSNSATNKEDE
ncbi:MAG: DNA polymerase III subunit gamma/tau [Alphaproteobacteria bacterium]|nr:DNA polymerase III subunit gamma/tau [Alphaproteobacteria bacterium]